MDGKFGTERCRQKERKRDRDREKDRDTKKETETDRKSKSKEMDGGETENKLLYKKMALNSTISDAR